MENKSIVTWNAIPPHYINEQIHKFSILDAIERASMLLDTDYTKNSEVLITGHRGRLIFATLPQTVMEPPNAEGLLPVTDGKARLGKIGNRIILFDRSPDMRDLITLYNGLSAVTIKIVEEAHPSPEGAPAVKVLDAEDLSYKC